MLESPHERLSWISDIEPRHLAGRDATAAAVHVDFEFEILDRDARAWTRGSWRHGVAGAVSFVRFVPYHCWSGHVLVIVRFGKRQVAPVAAYGHRASPHIDGTWTFSTGVASQRSGPGALSLHCRAPDVTQCDSAPDVAGIHPRRSRQCLAEIRSTTLSWSHRCSVCGYGV